MTITTLRTMKASVALLGVASAAHLTPRRERRLMVWTAPDGSVHQAERTVVTLTPKFGPALDFYNDSMAMSFCRGVIWTREHKGAA